MLQRILTQWTFTRVLYVGIGLFVMIQSITDLEWFGIAFGGYFAAMGLFAFGCAAGNCFGGNCETTNKPSSETERIT